MTGKKNVTRTPIPFEERCEYWADRVFSVQAEMLAAYERAMREDGVNQEVIAERLEREPSQISRWLRGLKNPTIRTLSEIALAMDCDLEIKFPALKDMPNHSSRI